MRTNYFLLCENVINDDKHRVSLINIFDIFNAQKFPAMVGRFVLAFSIAVGQKEAEANKFDLVIRITKDANDEKVLEIKGSSDRKLVKGNIVSNVDLSGAIAIKEQGRYTARLSINGDEMAELHFTAKVVRTKA